MKALKVIFMCNTVYAALIRENTTVMTPPITQSSSPRTGITPPLAKCSAHCDEPRVFDHNCLGCSTTAKATTLQLDANGDIVTNCLHYQKICIQLCATKKPKPRRRRYTLYPVQYEINTCEDQCREHWFCPFEVYDALFNNRRVLGPVVVPRTSNDVK